MPNRIIKESINESKRLAEVSQFSQDLYKRLITYADDYGRFNLEPDIIRARLFVRELDSVDVDDIIDGLIELVGVGKIKAYRNRSKPWEIFGFFPNWAEHQRVRNTRAKCPDPEEEFNDWYLRRFVPIEMKVAIFERDKFKCQLCGRSFELKGVPTKRAIRIIGGAVHIDHIVPVSQGGRATLENLRLLCAGCNLKRPRSLSAEQIIAESCGELRRVAADCGELPPNPIQLNPTQSESYSESNTGAAAQVMSEYNRIFAAYWDKPLILTDGRRKQINSRLKSFTAEQLVTAMEHLSQSDYHVGKSEKNTTFYAKPEFIFRNDEKVDEWLKKVPERPRKGDKPQPAPSMWDDPRLLMTHIQK